MPPQPVSTPVNPTTCSAVTAQAMSGGKFSASIWAILCALFHPSRAG
jgi:hypothetical protein